MERLRERPTDFPGYITLELLYESPTSRVVRAKKVGSNETRILKILEQDYLDGRDADRYLFENSFLEKLPDTALCKHIGMIRDDYAIVIEFSDHGFRVPSLLKSEIPRWNVERTLVLLTSLAESLSALHSMNVCHGAINADHVVINPHSGKAYLIDCADWAFDRADGQQSTWFEEDCQRDLRELGFLYKYLLSLWGFEQKKINGLFQLVQALIQRDRTPVYNEIRSVIADLAEAKNTFLLHGKIPLFNGFGACGRASVLAERFYGYERECAFLQRVIDPESRISAIFVSGESGIGKTTVVRKVFGLILSPKNLCLEQKIDQYVRFVDRGVFGSILSQLADHFFRKSEFERTRWLNGLFEYLGELLQEIRVFVPALAEVIKSPAKTREKEDDLLAKVAITKFLEYCVSHFQQMCVFIDDMQWVDEETLGIIHYLVAISPIENVKFVFAYRSEEVSGAHPVEKFREQITEGFVAAEFLKLQGLSEEALKQLMSDSLQCPPEMLQQLVWQESGGNPFWAKEYLLDHIDSGEFYFHESEGQWRQKKNVSAHIEKARLGKTTRTMHLRSIRRLHPDAQELIWLIATIGFKEKKEKVLHIAARLHEGGNFRLSPLAFGILFEELQFRGFIVLIIDEKSNADFQFRHDQIYQAAFHLKDQKSRMETHWLIAQILWESRFRSAIEISEHIDKSERTSILEKEMMFVYEAVTEAVDELYAQSAFHLAYHYAKKLLVLVDFSKYGCGEKQRAQLRLRTLELAYLAGNYLEVERLTQQVLEMNEDSLDQVRAQKYLTLMHMAKGQSRKAMDIFESAIRRFELPIPFRPGFINQLFCLVAIHFMSPWKSRSGSTAVSEYEKGLIEYLVAVSTVVYWTDQRYVPAFVFRQLQYERRDSDTTYAPYFIATASLIMAGYGSMTKAIKFGQYASLLIHENFDRYKEVYSRTACITLISTFFSSNHLKHSVPQLIRAFEVGIETGDFEFASYTGFQAGYHGFFAGIHLPELHQGVIARGKRIKALRQSIGYNNNQIYAQAIENLIYETEKPWVLSGKQYDEHKLKELHQLNNEYTTFTNFYLTKMMLAVTFGEIGEAARNAQSLRNYLKYATGVMVVPLYYFYASLIYSKMSRESKIWQSKFLSLCRSLWCIVKINRWCKASNTNFSHRRALMKAEFFASLKLDRIARKYFLSAISAAKAHQYPNDLALCFECYAHFLNERNDNKNARIEFEMSVDNYVRWGALAKAKQLRKRFLE